MPQQSLSPRSILSQHSRSTHPTSCQHLLSIIIICFRATTRSNRVKHDIIIWRNTMFFSKQKPSCNSFSYSGSYFLSFLHPLVHCRCGRCRFCNMVRVATWRMAHWVMSLVTRNHRHVFDDKDRSEEEVSSSSSFSCPSSCPSSCCGRCVSEMSQKKKSWWCSCAFPF